MQVKIKQRERSTIRLKQIPYSAASKATQPQAEAGTDNKRYMTALTTKQARDYAGFRSASAEGAVPGLATDQSAIFQAIFDALPEGASLRIPPGEYKLAQTVNISKTVHVDARGAKFTVTANSHGFVLKSEPTVRTLTADYVAGALALSVSATPSALAPGQPFKIISDAVDPANRDSGSATNQYRCGEWGHAGTGSTTTNIALRAPLRWPKGVDPVSASGEEARVDAYKTTYNARILILSGKTYSWDGGEIAFEEGHDADWASDAFVSVGWNRPRVTGLKITRGYRAGIVSAGDYSPVFEEVSVSQLNNNLSLGQYGYGIADASFCTKVIGGDFSELRHSYTTNAVVTPANDTSTQRILSQGRTVGARIIGASAAGAKDASFDTHHDAEDVMFIGCIATGGASYAVNLRGRDVYANDCEAVNCLFGVNAFTEFDSGDPDDDTYIAGKPEGYTRAFINNFKARVRGIVVTASRARFVSVNGLDAEASSHQLIRNQGSLVELAGRIRHKVSTFDGAVALAEATNSGVFESRDADAPNADWQTKIVFAKGCDVSVDASTATDASNTIQFFRCPTTSNLIENRGYIYASLSSAFNLLVNGSAASFLATEGSMLRWEVAGAADNTIGLSGLRGTKLRAQAVDETAWWDGTGIAKNTERLVYRDLPGTASAGTGAFVTNVYIPTFPAATSIDAAGHYVRYEVDVLKTGTTGAATIRSRINGDFNCDIPMAAADLYLHFVIDVFTTATGAQETRFRSVAGANPGAATASSIFGGSNTETASFAGVSHVLKFDVSAAVGDTITFKSIRVYSDISGFGV